jgi:hypothetical protein
MACALDALNDSPGSTVIMQKISNMITSNIVILVILLVVLGVLAFGLYYFMSSLINTLSTYTTAIKNSASTVNSNSLHDREADNELYPEPKDPNNPEEDDTSIKVDPTKFMAKSKRDFLKKLEVENKEYNKEKTDLMVRRMRYPENDDMVDSQILYKDYDDYKYDYETD